MKLSGAIYCTQHYRTLSVETRLMHCMLVGCVFLKKILASMCLFKNIQRIWKVNSASQLRENKHVACIFKKNLHCVYNQQIPTTNFHYNNIDRKYSDEQQHITVNEGISWTVKWRLHTNSLRHLTFWNNFFIYNISDKISIHTRLVIVKGLWFPWLLISFMVF